MVKEEICVEYLEQVLFSLTWIEVRRGQLVYTDTDILFQLQK